MIDRETKWRKVATRLPGHSHLTGMFPHGYQTAGALAYAVRRLLRDSKEHNLPFVVIHSGDLTASGTQEEFSVGLTYLNHGHYLENGQVAGLRLEDEFGQRPFDVPGNHDLWCRRSPKDHGAFTSHFGGKYPRNFRIETNRGKAFFFGLDSNRSSLWQHRLANGEIPTADLDELRDDLADARAAGAISVVCLHHPLFLRRRGTPRMCQAEIQRLKFREQVAKSLAEAGTHVVLAGHVHKQQHLKRFDVLQFIAGSACQIGSRPSFWLLDLYSRGVRYTYFHMPKHSIHFEAAGSRSGFTRYDHSEQATSLRAMPAERQ